MKKIVIRVLLCLLAFVVVIIGTGCYFLFKEPDKPAQSTPGNTVVDVQGSTYLAVIDEGGTTYAVVTDAAGNRYAASYNGSQVGETVAQINDQVALDDLPTNYTGPSVNITTASAEQTTTSASSQPVTEPSQSGTEPSTQVTQPTVTQTPTQSTGLTAYRIEMYQQIFAGGTYLMEFTSNDEDLGDLPITMAIKNGNMYIETSIEGMVCTMLYNKSSDTMYLLFDDWKKYCELTEEILGEDFDMSSMATDFSASDIGEVSVSTVNLNGRDLILESYTNTDGSIVNYYFDGENIVRRDSISTSGLVDTIEFTTFTTNVPDSYFEVPSDYGYINLSWLGMLM